MKQRVEQEERLKILQMAAREHDVVKRFIGGPLG